MNTQNQTVQLLARTQTMSLRWPAAAISHSPRRVAVPVLVAATLLLPVTAPAQGAVAWVQRYNGPGNGTDRASDIAVSSNGNVYVTGSAYGASGDDYATIAYSSAGLPLWTNYYDGPEGGNDRAEGVAADASGNAFVAGTSYRPDLTSSAVATIKYSSAGVPLWTNRYNAPGYLSSYRTFIALDATGNVFVIGSTTKDRITADGFTLKYSSAGALLWARTYSGYGNGFPSALAVDPSGNVVVTGSTGDNTNDRLTLKYSSAGALLWTKRYIGPAIGAATANALAVDADGNVIVTGGWGTPNWEFLTIKYSSAGLPLWTNRDYVGAAAAVAADASGNVYVAGYSGGDYATLKYSSAGLPLWTNRYNGPGNAIDEVAAMALDCGGNAYVTGVSDGNGSGDDYATVAYASSGVPVWTNRYNGPANSIDYANAVAVDAGGSVYVTGVSFGATTGGDYVTVKYVTPPAIAYQPLSRTNAVGTTANFSVEAAGNVPLSYQWRMQGTNLVDAGNVSGVTTTNLLIANVQFADAGGYTVVVTNVYGSVTSTVAQLTIYIPLNPGRFSNFAYSPATGFSFIFRDGTLGRQYRIQTLSSLAGASWVDWQNFTYNGPVGFMDVGAIGAEKRFYRAVSP